jgi:hypothetical protein
MLEPDFDPLPSFRSDDAATRRCAKARVRFGFDRLAALLNRPSRVKVRYKHLQRADMAEASRQGRRRLQIGRRIH